MNSREKAIVLSVVVPLFNEAASLGQFHNRLLAIVDKATDGKYEIIYCNDGSTDQTATIVHDLRANNNHIKLLSLSRNFGKELALAAGISAAKGKAVLMIDGDGQHPCEKIPEFIRAWRSGAKVVIGVQPNYKRPGIIKRLGSHVFYKVYNRLTETESHPGASDFRLIDSTVQRELIKLNEPDRITRGLIDWVGFSRSYIEFDTHERIGGKASYSLRKLVNLATHSFISMSPMPLYIFGYLGIIITSLSLLLGISVVIEQLLLRDPLNWNFTGTAMLGIMTLFLVGLLLMAQGITALYISHIHNQTKGRPLFIIDYEESLGIDEL